MTGKRSAYRPSSLMNAVEFGRLVGLSDSALLYDRKNHFPPLVPFVMAPGGPRYRKSEAAAVRKKLDKIRQRAGI